MQSAGKFSPRFAGMALTSLGEIGLFIRETLYPLKTSRSPEAHVFVIGSSFPNSVCVALCETIDAESMRQVEVCQFKVV